jgi:excisionase family DNA binding protein
MDDIFLTSDEVLEYLQINLRTLYRLIKAGKIPAVRIGRQWRFRKTEIDHRLASDSTALHAAASSAVRESKADR